MLISSYLDHTNHFSTGFPAGKVVFSKSRLILNLLLTCFALRLKTVVLLKAHKGLQGPLPSSLPASPSTMSPPSSSQAHRFYASSPSNMPYSLTSPTFLRAIHMLGMLFSSSWSELLSLFRTSLSWRTLPCSQMLGLVPL